MPSLGCFVPKFIFTGRNVGYLDEKGKEHQVAEDAKRVENVPQGGFKFVSCLAGYNSYNYNHRDTIVMEHPAGFHFHVGVPAFCNALKECGMEASTGVLGKRMVLAWEKGVMEFLVEGTEKFDELIKKSEGIFDGSLQIPLDRLEAGKVYQRANGECELYLGSVEVHRVTERTAKADELSMVSDDKFWVIHKHDSWNGKNYIRKVSKTKKKVHLSVWMSMNGPALIDAGCCQCFTASRNYVKVVGYHPDWESIREFCITAEKRKGYYDSIADPVAYCKYEEMDARAFGRIYPRTHYSHEYKYWRKCADGFEKGSRRILISSQELWNDYLAGKTVKEDVGYYQSECSINDVLWFHPYCRRYYTVSGKLLHEEVPGTRFSGGTPKTMDVEPPKTL